MDKSKKLKNFDTANWLKNRFKNQVKYKYILSERELRQQIMMKAVFKSIDRDQSKFLDRQELYDMFRRYGINITKTQLKEFFKRIDKDEDDKLNWNDFKQALQNQEALQKFIELMRKIRESNEKKGEDDEMYFVPLSFPNMIQYLNYHVLRDEQIQQIKSEHLNTQQKFQQCKNLLSLDKVCFHQEDEEVDKKVEKDKIDKENEKDEEEEAFIKMAKRKNEHQQIVLQKRLQEREQKEQRQQRIRKLSASQYYRTENDSTSRSIRKNQQSSIQDTSNEQQTEFISIEQIIKELPFVSENKKIKTSMMMVERINLNESANHFQYNQKKEKQETRTQSAPRGRYFSNQYMMNIQTPVKGYERRLSIPKRIRVTSQTEQLRFDTKCLF